MGYKEKLSKSLDKEIWVDKLTDPQKFIFVGASMFIILTFLYCIGGFDCPTN